MTGREEKLYINEWFNYSYFFVIGWWSTNTMIPKQQNVLDNAHAKESRTQLILFVVKNHGGSLPSSLMILVVAVLRHSVNYSQQS
jgi:hypothetical protein